MAIVEHGSTPAVVEGTAGGDLVTASFSPPAGSLVVAMVAGGYGGSDTVTVADSSGGGNWSGISEPFGGSGGGIAAIYHKYFSAAPGSITVSADFSASVNGATCLVVKVLTGADSTLGSTGQRERGIGNLVHEDVTATVEGSQIYCAANLAFSEASSTASVEANTTVYSFKSDDLSVASAFGSTNLTASTTQQTYGYQVANTANEDSAGSVVHIEVVPGPENPSGSLAVSAPSAQVAASGEAAIAWPTFVAAGTPDSAAGAITPGLPAGWQQDDVFLLSVETVGSDTLATPSGWTEVTSSPQFIGGAGGSATRCTVFWRRATASESAPTVTGAVDHAVGVITAYRGCATDGSPIDVDGGGTDPDNDGIATVGGITTTETNTLVVVNVGCTDASAGLALSGTSLDSFTERVNTETTLGNAGTIGVWTGVKPAAGATGDASLTTSTATRNAWVVLALKPLQLVEGDLTVSAPLPQVSVDAEKTIDADLPISAPFPQVGIEADAVVAVQLAPSAPLPQVAVTAALEQNHLAVSAPAPVIDMDGQGQVIVGPFGVTAPAAQAQVAADAVVAGTLLHQAPFPLTSVDAEATAAGTLDATAPGATFAAAVEVTAAGTLGMVGPAAAYDSLGHEYAIGPLTLTAPFPAFFASIETRIFGRRVKVVEPDPNHRVLEVPVDQPPETFYV